MLFILVLWLICGFRNPSEIENYQFQAIALIVSQLIVVLFANNYGGILHRKRFDELLSVIKYIIKIVVVALVYLFVVKSSATVSLLQLGFTSLLFVVIDFVFRQLNKKGFSKAAFEKVSLLSW